jgi:hypothetical protein
MARKHAPGHEPYSPVDEKLMRSLPSVVSPSVTEASIKDYAGEGYKFEQSDTAAPSQVEAKLIAPTHEPMDKQLKFQVSATERREIKRVVARLGAELETSIDWSHVARAMMVILREAEDEIAKHARRSEPLTRPRNSDALGLAEFEEQIAQILLRSFRSVNAVR